MCLFLCGSLVLTQASYNPNVPDFITVGLDTEMLATLKGTIFSAVNNNNNNNNNNYFICTLNINTDYIKE